MDKNVAKTLVARDLFKIRVLECETGYAVASTVYGKEYFGRAPTLASIAVLIEDLLCAYGEQRA